MVTTSCPTPASPLPVVSFPTDRHPSNLPSPFLPASQNRRRMISEDWDCDPMPPDPPSGGREFEQQWKHHLAVYISCSVLRQPRILLRIIEMCIEIECVSQYWLVVEPSGCRWCFFTFIALVGKVKVNSCLLVECGSPRHSIFASQNETCGRLFPESPEWGRERENMWWRME